jgi:hypothetical protein
LARGADIMFPCVPGMIMIETIAQPGPLTLARVQAEVTAANGWLVIMTVNGQCRTQICDTPMPVSWKDLILAFEFVGASNPGHGIGGEDRAR